MKIIIEIYHENKIFLLNFITQVFNACMSFAFMLVTSNFMGAEIRGKYSIIINFNAIMLLLLNVGLPSVIVFLLNKKTITKEEAFFSGLALSFIQTFLFYLFFHFLLDPRIINIKIEIIQSFLFFFFFLNTITIQILISQQNFLLQNISTVVANIFCFILFFSTKLIFVNTKLEFILLLNLLLQLLLSIIYFFKLNIINTKPVFIKRATIKSTLNYSIIGYIGNLVQTVVYKSDVLVLKNFVDFKLLGNYSLSVVLSQFIWLLPSSMASILYTKISLIENKKEIHLLITKTLKSLFVIQLLMVIISPFLINITSKYLLIKDLNRVFDFIYYILPGIFIFSFSIILGSFFSGVGRQEVNTKGALIGFIIFIISIFPLISKFKIYGAIISTTLAYLSNTIFMFYSYSKSKQTN